MSAVATVAAVAEILNLANAAMQVGMTLQAEAIRLQQLHAQGQTLSDDELAVHIASARAHLDELKKLTGGEA